MEKRAASLLLLFAPGGEEGPKETGARVGRRKEFSSGAEVDGGQQWQPRDLQFPAARAMAVASSGGGRRYGCERCGWKQFKGDGRRWVDSADAVGTAAASSSSSQRRRDRAHVAKAKPAPAWRQRSLCTRGLGLAYVARKERARPRRSLR